MESKSGKIEKFEDLLSWQKSQELSLFVYKLLRELKDYSFRDQLQRAVISIGNNRAEGFERSGNKEFRYFLFVAKGSCGEVRSMLYIAKALGYISEKDFKKAYSIAMDISRLIYGLIKKL